MAKLNYVEGDYKEALNIYARVGLDDLPLTAVPPYRLRMIAEAYATKGEDRVPSSRPLLDRCALDWQLIWLFPARLPGSVLLCVLGDVKLITLFPQRLGSIVSTFW